MQARQHLPSIFVEGREQALQVDRQLAALSTSRYVYRGVCPTYESVMPLAGGC